MKKIIYFSLFTFYFSLLLAACSSLVTEENKDIIERDTFVSILVGMHVTDVLLIQDRQFDRNLNDTTGKKSHYNFLFNKYNINEYRFVKTVEYYSERTKEYGEIYTDVVDELSKRRADIILVIDSTQNSEIEQLPEEKQDSLRNKLEKSKIDSLKKRGVRNLKENKIR